MNYDRGLIAAILREGDEAVKKCRLGLPDSSFLKGESKQVYEFITDYVVTYGGCPSNELIKQHLGIDFEDASDPLGLSEVTEAPVGFWIDEIKKRRLFESLKTSAMSLYEHLDKGDIDDGLASLEASLVAIRKDQLSGDSGVEKIGPLGKEAIEYYERMKRGERGIPLPWEGMNDATLGIWPQDLGLFVARPGTGKCVEENTLIVDPDTGIRKTIRELYESDEQCNVLSWSKKGGVHKRGITAKVDTGTKECLEVTLRSGRKIVATHEHPFLTPEGWVRADSLGKLNIAVPAHIPGPSNPVSLPKYEVDLWAILLSEGSYSGRHVGFSSADPEFIQIAKEAASSIGVDLVHRSNYDYDFVRIESSGPNKVRDLLREHEADLKKAVDKVVPDCIFSLPNEQVRRFLSVFFMGDGYVCKKGMPGIGLGSRALVEQLQHLFLRVGVQTTFKYKRVMYGDSHRDSWMLTVVASSLENFAKLNLWGEKRSNLDKLINTNRNPNVGMPRISDATKDKLSLYSASKSGKHNGGFHTKVADELGRVQFQTRDLFGNQNSVKPTAFKAFAKVYDIHQFDWWWDSDIYWDDVVSVTPVGEKKIYDLTVEPTSCFVANDIIVHNTWAAVLIALHAWEQGHKVLFATTEISRSRIAMRLLSAKYKLDYGLFRKGALTSAQEKFFREEVEKLQLDENFFVAGGDFDFRISNYRSLIEEIKPDLCILDGAYLLKVEGKDRTQKTANAFDEIKRISNATSVPQVVTMQFNRNAKANMTESFDLSNIAQSDAAGWNADFAYAMGWGPEGPSGGRMKFVPMKVREGFGGEITANWNFKEMDFSEVPTDASDALAPAIGYGGTVFTRKKDSSDEAEETETEDNKPKDDDDFPF